MLINTVHNDRPIIARTTLSIFSSTCTRHRVIGEIAVVVSKERRDSSIEEGLEKIVIVNNSGSNETRGSIKDVFENEAGDLSWRHRAWVDARRNEVAQTLITAKLDGTTKVEAVDVNKEIGKGERGRAAEPVLWESLIKEEGGYIAKVRCSICSEGQPIPISEQIILMRDFVARHKE